MEITTNPIDLDQKFYNRLYIDTLLFIETELMFAMNKRQEQELKEKFIAVQNEIQKRTSSQVTKREYNIFKKESKRDRYNPFYEAYKREQRQREKREQKRK